jgi:hypothetical protein
VITAKFENAPGILLLAPVRGLASEVPRLLSELEAFAPTRLGVGLFSLREQLVPGGEAGF